MRLGFFITRKFAAKGVLCAPDPVGLFLDRRLRGMTVKCR